MLLFEPRKEIFGSTYFEIIFLWCAAVQQQENIFHGGEFPRTHMHLKPKEKMTHDPWLFEGVVFFFHKVGSKDLFVLSLLQR